MKQHTTWQARRHAHIERYPLRLIEPTHWLIVLFRSLLRGTNPV